MAIHVGFVRAGWPGLVAGGACFILPAMLITMGLAMAYSRYGRLPEAGWILYGVKPVIIAVVVQAVWGLARKAIGTPLGRRDGAGRSGPRSPRRQRGRAPVRGRARPAAPAQRGGGGEGADADPAWTPRHRLRGPERARSRHDRRRGPLLPQLALVFLKVGSILFGSGYVLLAFLRPDLVERTGWLTDAQLLDAVAVGQFTRVRC
jgi:chromate transporter